LRLKLTHLNYILFGRYAYNVIDRHFNAAMTNPSL